MTKTPEGIGTEVAGAEANKENESMTPEQAQAQAGAEELESAKKIARNVRFETDGIDPRKVLNLTKKQREILKEGAAEVAEIEKIEEKPGLVGRDHNDTSYLFELRRKKEKIKKDMRIASLVLEEMMKKEGEEGIGSIPETERVVRNNAEAEDVKRGLLKDMEGLRKKVFALNEKANPLLNTIDEKMRRDSQSQISEKMTADGNIEEKAEEFKTNVSSLLTQARIPSPYKEQIVGISGNIKSKEDLNGFAGKINQIAQGIPVPNFLGILGPKGKEAKALKSAISGIAKQADIRGYSEAFSSLDAVNAKVEKLAGELKGLAPGLEQFRQEDDSISGERAAVLKRRKEEVPYQSEDTERIFDFDRDFSKKFRELSENQGSDTQQTRFGRIEGIIWNCNNIKLADWRTFLEVLKSGGLKTKF